MDSKSQVSLEFLLILAGVILIATTIAFFIKTSIVGGMTKEAKELGKKVEWKI